MTDRRQVVHAAAPGRSSAIGLRTRPRVVVVGGGIAGLTAATALAERGIEVQLWERQDYLGGRVGGWTEDLGQGDTVGMNRGFHAFFRQYYNLRALLRRTDPDLSRLTAVDDYPLVDAHGHRDTFQGLPQTPPLNALAFALRSPTFRPMDLVRINVAAAAPLATVSIPGIYDQLDHVDAETFLKDINFPEAARHLAFEVFSRSFFAQPDQLSAAELASMFHIYFLGSSEGLLFDVAGSNFDTCLWNPLREYLFGYGATVRTGVTVAAIEHDAGRFTVTDDTGGSAEVDAVVLAADVAGLQRIVAASPTLGDSDWRAQVQALQTAPPFVVHRLWLDRPVRADRAPFLGTGGLKPLDNISVVDRYETEAAAWAADHGGSVVELHAYAAPDAADRDAMREQLLGRLYQLYPELTDATIVAERMICHEDCPQFSPGSHADRPGVVTPQTGLVLAGDGIRIDLPVALMERAATTGFAAANAVLARWHIAGHPLHTVPVRGRSALLRRLVERTGRSTT
ncbi:MAG: FAD-dependent oxidoreductase [Mycobacterium sp.]